ncbi:hypothetical protein AVEN_13541-1 [Araneus ventricosus]|uniref:Uncharacterized protein n=1 Tax=Araneus ventricosus TaxID=182803 RepID=A0A4Y2D6U4_ARAVE|nr:hypothetical protein AVEN_13541-1 [Araneus ventricosus]
MQVVTMVCYGKQLTNTETGPSLSEENNDRKDECSRPIKLGGGLLLSLEGRSSVESGFEPATFRQSHRESSLAVSHGNATPTKKGLIGIQPLLSVVWSHLAA